jgi:hypothetical protein
MIFVSTGSYEPGESSSLVLQVGFRLAILPVLLPKETVYNIHQWWKESKKSWHGLALARGAHVKS